METPTFRTTVLSDPNHDDLVVEGYIDDHLVLIMGQDQTLTKFFIELKPGQKLLVPQEHFEHLLALCKKRLIDLGGRIPEVKGDSDNPLT